MKRRTNFWWIPLVAVLLLTAGCGKDNNSGVAAADSPDETGAGSNPIGAGKSSGASSAHRAPAGSAAAAVLAVVDGLKENRLDAFWDFLPASYQKDLNDLVHRFAERMDPQLWAKSVVTLRKLAGVLKEQNEYLVAIRASQIENEGRQADPKALAAEMTAIGNLLETLLGSDLADLEKLKTVDGKKFLAGTGRRLLDQLRATGHDPFAELGDLSDLTVSQASSEGDSATLAIQGPDGPAKDHEFVRVEGQWIPRTIAKNWYENMMQANAWLSLLSPDNLKEDKPQIMALLSAVDGVLNQMAAAKSQNEFMSALARAEETQKKFLPLIVRLVGSAPTDEADAGAANSDEPIELVTVVVKGTLDEIAQDNLRDKLKGVVDEGGLPETELTGDDETTIYRIGPVSDVEAFAARLSFLKNVHVDAKGRVITAEPK
jgi:hypothetical protein